MVVLRSVGRLIPSERLELRRLTSDVMRCECDTRRNVCVCSVGFRIPNNLYVMNNCLSKHFSL